MPYSTTLSLLLSPLGNLPLESKDAVDVELKSVILILTPTLLAVASDKWTYSLPSALLALAPSVQVRGKTVGYSTAGAADEAAAEEAAALEAAAEEAAALEAAADDGLPEDGAAEDLSPPPLQATAVIANKRANAPKTLFIFIKSSFLARVRYVSLIFLIVFNSKPLCAKKQTTKEKSRGYGLFFY